MSAYLTRCRPSSARLALGAVAASFHNSQSDLVEVAKQWLDAGLTKRAEDELQRVEKFVSYKTDVGAGFHLELAAILTRQGQRGSEAKRIQTRVMQDASSSSLR